MGTIGRPIPNDRYDTYTKNEVDTKDSTLEAKDAAQDTAIGTAQSTADAKADIVPGQIIYHAGTTAPTGYLVCDGSEVSQTTYAALFAAIGTSWNTTGGAAAPAGGNFRIPPSQIGNLGLYMRGVGATNGVVGTYQPDVFKSHNHSERYASHTTWNVVYSAGPAMSSQTTGVTGSTGDAIETRPRSITVLMCIKY